MPARTKRSAPAAPTAQLVIGKVRGVIEITPARLEPCIEHATLGSKAQNPAADTWRGEIGVVAEIGEITDGLDEGLCLIELPALHIEARTERHLEEVEVDVLQRALEIGGRISESVEFDLVALLQIERVMQRADIECAPARTADRLLVEREIDAVQRDALRAGPKLALLSQRMALKIVAEKGGGSAVSESCCR